MTHFNKASTFPFEQLEAYVPSGHFCEVHMDLLNIVTIVLTHIST